MQDDILYMLWYHRHFGKTKKGKKALEFYGSCKNLYEAVFSGKEETGLLKTAPREKYTAFNVFDAEDIVSICEKYGWHIIPCDSPLYPRLLLETDDYPGILFADGNTEFLKASVKFAVVGSREASDTALEIAANSAYNLAKTGAVIVSGAALGIDSAAHHGAINSGGGTIGVLGCGLGNGYMSRIGDFYQKMKNSGVYVTEMFPFENVSRSSFPERNRLISGMSHALLVACAARGSGTLNTAAHAKKQKRRIYVPAPEICYSPGCEQLLDDGAYTFYSAGDIAYPFRDMYEEGTFNENYCNKALTVKNRAVTEDMSFPKSKARVSRQEKATEQMPCEENKQEEKAIRSAKNKPSEKKISEEAVSVEADQKKQELIATLTPDERAVYELLAKGEANANELCREMNVPVFKVLIAQTGLSMKGLIKIKDGSILERI